MGWKFLTLFFFNSLAVYVYLSVRHRKKTVYNNFTHKISHLKLTGSIAVSWLYAIYVDGLAAIAENEIVGTCIFASTIEMFTVCVRIDVLNCVCVFAWINVFYAMAINMPRWNNKLNHENDSIQWNNIETCRYSNWIKQPTHNNNRKREREREKHTRWKAAWKTFQITETSNQPKNKNCNNHTYVYLYMCYNARIYTKILSFLLL